MPYWFPSTEIQYFRQYMYIRLLQSWPLVKILTGPVHFRMILYVPLVGIQNPGSQKFWELKWRALSRFSAFIACVSSCLELHSTNITQLTDICNFLWAKPHWRQSFARCVDYISRRNNVLLVKSHRFSWLCHVCGMKLKTWGSTCTKST